MNWRIETRRWAGLLSVFAATGLGGCAAAADTPPAAKQAPAPAAMETVRVGTARLESTLRLPAELVADQTVHLHAKVDSYVERLAVDIGSRVSKGELLVQLEAPEIGARLASARAAWKAVEARHFASKANYDRIVRTSAVEGAIAPDAIDQAKAKEQADAAQLAAAKSTYDEVRALLGYLDVRAPFDGIVTERNAELGSFVGPGGRGGGRPMLVVQSTDRLRLRVAVQEAHVPQVEIGSTIRFSVPTSPGREFAAAVTRKSGALDEALRGERIEADVDNADGVLLPNLVADARISLQAPGLALVVPTSALVESTMGTYVLRVSDGKARRVPVKKGMRSADAVEVFGDLQEGDVVVAKATEMMPDGMPIRAVETVAAR